MKARRFFLLLWLCLTFGSIENLFAQYWGEMVLEKSFERENFFFQSTELKPFGLSTFSSVAPGLFSDNLLNLSINPSQAWQDSAQNVYVYADFRSVHNLQNAPYGIVPLWGYANVRADYNWIYPIYYSEPRQETVPFFAGAFLIRPFQISGRKPYFGVSYRMIFQDEDYYGVPFDIYRSVFGADYQGNRIVESTDLPTIDRYRGEDRMNKTGHFLSIFVGSEITNWLNFGARLNRTTFNRDGKFGSRNFWNDSNDRSLWESWEERNQDYDHWDFSGGLTLKLSEKMSLGVKAGYLNGNALQNLGTVDSSYYKSGEIGQSDQWSFYSRTGFSDKLWKHEGKTYYGGMDFRFQLSSSLNSVFYFKREKTDIDVLLTANISDTSYSTYRYSWNENISDHAYTYFLGDQRSGSGAISQERNIFSWLFHWQMDEKRELRFGFQAETFDRKTNTSEKVRAKRFSQSSYSNSNPDYGSGDNYYSNTESKELIWTFRARRTDIRIPVVFEWRVSPRVDLILGINRTMSRWIIDDETLAKFDFRETVENSNTTRNENFAERYTSPQEKRTQIQTTMMGGIVFHPNENLSVRMLAVPRFEDRYNGSELSTVEWWLSLNFSK